MDCILFYGFLEEFEVFDEMVVDVVIDEVCEEMFVFDILVVLEELEVVEE